MLPADPAWRVGGNDFGVDPGKEDPRRARVFVGRVPEPAVLIAALAMAPAHECRK